jgi:hypothetical protein
VIEEYFSPAIEEFFFKVFVSVDNRLIDVCDWRRISIYIIPGLFRLAFFIVFELSFFCQLECIFALTAVLACRYFSINFLSTCKYEK